MKLLISNQDPVPRDRLFGLSHGFAGIFLLLLFVLVAGCGDSSGPTEPDGNIVFSYLPDTGDLEMTILQNQFFKVTASPASDFSVDWFVNGEPLFQGKTFTYFPSRVGQDTLRAEALAGGASDQRQWVIRVVSSIQERPPEVMTVALEDGPEPGEVVAQWLDVAGSTYPIQDYVVAVSYGGPINVDNWNAVAMKDTVPDTDSFQYQKPYSLNYGEIAWFAVRALDVKGQMSDITRAYAHTVTYPWSLGLRVLDDHEVPVPQVILKWTANWVTYSGNTPSNGLVEIGPFRNIDLIKLETVINNGEVIGDYYDFIDPEISVNDGTLLDILLMPRFGIDVLCEAGFDDDFLSYFRYMTTTDRESTLRPNYHLLKWESWPLQVFVPEFQREDGLELRPVTLEGMAAWNSVMGEEYFQVVDSLAAADIYFSFLELDNYKGLVTVMEPSDQDYSIGSVIPEKMRVEMDSKPASSEDSFRMVAMHELGHALGIPRHAPCSGPSYLMYTAVSSSIDDENGGIHPDEQNMVRMIRHLPQAMDMTLFVLD